MNVIRMPVELSQPKVAQIEQPAKSQLEWRAVSRIGESLSSDELPYDAAVLLAGVSREIYEPATDRLLEFVKAKNGEHARLIERDGTRAIVFTLEGYAFVVFRGTDSLKDWWTDCKCWYADRPRRHAGFCAAWRRVALEVRQWLAELPAGGTGVVLSGHSLGGALAVLAAFELSDDYPVAAIITFGAPRVGGFAFRRAFNLKPAGPNRDARPLSAVTWRFVNRGDLVAAMPPPLFYYHVGHAVGVSRLGLTSITSPGALFPIRVDSGLQRLEYFTNDLSITPTPVSPGLDSGRVQWRGTFEVLSYFGSYLIGFAFGWVGWCIARLTRATVLAGADHPSQFYVEAIPMRLERVVTFSRPFL